jgi:hypothetical protein
MILVIIIVYSINQTGTAFVAKTPCCCKKRREQVAMNIQATIHTVVSCLKRQENSSNQSYNEANGRATVHLLTGTLTAVLLVLPGESDVLGNGLVQALTIGNVQTSQVIRYLEEHVAAVVQTLEPFSVVREPHIAVCCGCVAQEDALNLLGEVVGELWVILHDIRVGRVGDENELPLRESLEDLLQKVHANRQRSRDVREVEWSGVEGAAGVGLVDEVHVETGALLRSSGEVMEMRAVRQGARPVGIDIGHVHPWCERTSKRVQQALLGIVDLGDTQNVINVRDKGDSLVGHQESGGVATVCAVGVDIQALHIVCLVSVQKAVALDGHKSIKVTELSRLVGELDCLDTTSCGNAVAAARLAIAALHWGRLERHGDVLISLLNNVDGASQVAGLLLLIVRKLVNARADQENISEVVDLLL